MVILDADNSRDHVLAELRSHGPLVTQGCYLMVADSIIGHLDAGQTRAIACGYISSATSR
jgi:cephalosporin hydroxylase